MTLLLLLLAAHPQRVPLRWHQGVPLLGLRTAPRTRACSR